MTLHIIIQIENDIILNVITSLLCVIANVAFCRMLLIFNEMKSGLKYRIYLILLIASAWWHR